MGQIRDIFRSDSVHFGAPRQNVLNLIRKFPGFVPFGAKSGNRGLGSACLIKRDTDTTDLGLQSLPLSGSVGADFV